MKWMLVVPRADTDTINERLKVRMRISILIYISLTKYGFITIVSVSILTNTSQYNIQQTLIAVISA